MDNLYGMLLFTCAILSQFAYPWNGYVINLPRIMLDEDPCHTYPRVLRPFVHAALQFFFGAAGGLLLRPLSNLSEWGKKGSSGNFCNLIRDT
jgi:hypothetical protein